MGAVFENRIIQFINDICNITGLEPPDLRYQRYVGKKQNVEKVRYSIFERGLRGKLAEVSKNSLKYDLF